MGNTQSSAGQGRGASGHQDGLDRKVSNDSESGAARQTFRWSSRASDSPSSAQRISRHGDRHKLQMVDEDLEDRPISHVRSQSRDKSPSELQSPSGGANEPTSSSANGSIATFLHWNKGGHDVAVVGSFNGWKTKVKMVKSSNDFSVLVNLPRGTHRLNFVVDGEFKCSEELPSATDSYGNLVNYIEVTDEELTLAHDPTQYALQQMPDLGNDEYAAEIPAWIQADIAPLYETKEARPPSLPAQLETVILNNAAAYRGDHSLLPTPNHSVLNHLAATSVKNRVLAVACTSRYRNKYLTTILYTPAD